MNLAELKKLASQAEYTTLERETILKLIAVVEAMQYLNEHSLWANAHGKAVIQSALKELE